jgi:23S rRNA (uracil1939-C5)-methyltransferase
MMQETSVSPDAPVPASRQRTFARPQQPALRRAWRAPAEPVDALTTCMHKKACGGCRYVNNDYKSSLDTKYNAGLAELESAGLLKGLKILPPVPSPRPLGYRTLFKLAVRPGFGRKFAIGLFQPGTHRVGPSMETCPVHVSALTRMLRDLQTELETSSLTPFDENAGEGDLRYLVARASHLTGEIQLTFVVTKPQKVELTRIVGRLKSLGHKIASSHMNINADSGNAIFGKETVRIGGTDGLRERINDLGYEISPTSFFQINPWQAAQLYNRVAEFAGPAPSSSAVAWDLYCGNGQIAMTLAKSGWRVLGIEENTAAAASALLNAERNELDSKITIHAARVEDSEKDIPKWASTPSLIVVNPSRRGLHENARSMLAHMLRLNPSTRFIYVSCDVTTLKRDLAFLVESGCRVRHVEGFDMFAQTDQMEWLAVVSRA